MFHIRLYSLEDEMRAVCPWASLSSCVQMRGSVSGQADSSPIPTITVTRHQSVSKKFGPSALWATVAPQQPLVLLNKPSTCWPCPFPYLCPNSKPCALLNLTTLCSTCVLAAVALSVHTVLLWKCEVLDLTKKTKLHIVLFSWMPTVPQEALSVFDSSPVGVY